MKLSPGDLIDQKYRIRRMLGTGGMGSVYEAENTRVERRVAIKVMHQVRDQQDITRFEREARAAQIGSPYIVQVFDLGYLSDGAPYMVMEYLAGESLGERLQRVQRIAASELLPIARQILEALSAAHRAGIIHRDLKPDNVFLVRDEENGQESVKLLDFGISKFTDAARKAADVSLTRSGVAVGTPHYMSPEQVQGSKELDIRTDLYSLGIIMYRCLSGQLPFQSDDVAPLLVQILLEQARPLTEVLPEADPNLSAIISRAMARKADDRFQTATEFRNALGQWENSQSARLALPPTPTALDANRTTPSPVFSPGLQLATNPSWSSTNADIPDPRRTLRTIGLAILFTAAGTGGLLLAYRLWSTEPPATAGAVATPPATLATPVVVPGAPPPVVQPRLGAVAPNSAAPDLHEPAAMPVLHHPSHVAAAVREVSAPVSPAQPVPPPVAVTPPAPAQAMTPPLAATPPAPGAAEPAAPGATVEETPDNRHISRGVH